MANNLYTARRKAMIYNKFGRRCAYCGFDIKFNKMIMEHFHPRAKSGKANLTNLYPSCRRCNILKASLTIDEFRNKLAAKFKWGQIVFYFEIFKNA